MTTLLSIACLCCCVHAANPMGEAAVSPTELKGNFTILRQDSRLNLSDMNLSLVLSPTYGTGQTVKFTAPYSGWKLGHVLVAASDGWNANSNESPKYLPFAIEIRDANLKILDHYSDAQFAYFTRPTTFGISNIDIPDIPIVDDFYVCFYGYRELGLAAEKQNATGNSYYYERLTGNLYNASLPLQNNQTLPVNWIIWVAGS